MHPSIQSFIERSNTHQKDIAKELQQSPLPQILSNPPSLHASITPPISILTHLDTHSV
eukprot:m.378615 g.378615  ORF g.378615 m.378615 type:complete len:58 (-) comp94773_c0_seq1:3-176(-)